MKSYFKKLDILGCEYDPPTEFDRPELLAKLYGRHFAPAEQGSGKIVVLGHHNSGTSMVTRLVMLMGAFAGNYETISINHNNKLKYYEPFAVSFFHDAFLAKFTDKRFRPYHGQSLNFDSMTEEDKEQFSCFAKKQMADMNRHQPWVMKDPRMALVMPLWRPYIGTPVCVFVHKDPVKTSMSLASNMKKSAQSTDTALMSAQRWLDLWGATFEQGLEGCRGAPTVVFNSRNVISDPDAAIAELHRLLTGVGVRGLRIPDADEVRAQVKEHIRLGPRRYRARADLGFTSATRVDHSMPRMSPKQLAMETAVQQYMEQIEGKQDGVNFTSVADGILDLAAKLHAEASRRAAAV